MFATVTLTRMQTMVLRHLVHLARGGYLEAHLDAIRDLFGAGARDAIFPLVEQGLIVIDYPRVWLTPAGRRLGGLS